MRFEWDENKSRQNLLKHYVRFETATLVFDDPYMLLEQDPVGDEERWNTLGRVAPGVVLFVVHTWLEGTARKSFALSRRAQRNRVKGENMRKLSKEQKRDIARLAAMKDEDIYFSDIPLKLDWSKAEVGKFYRPPKKTVTMRLDSDVIEWLKGFGKGYQTRANLLLRHAMASATERPTQAGQRGKRTRQAHASA